MTTRFFACYWLIFNLLAGVSSLVFHAATAAEEPPPNLGTRRAGDDWPTFLGPTGDGKSPEKGVLIPWPKQGPKIVWSRKLGTSYGGPTVCRGRLFQFDRFGDQARLYCVHAETGSPLWKYEYPTAYEDHYGYNNGPRCSPLVDGNRVYVLGAEGMLACVRADSGQEVWKLDTAKQFGVVQNFFGVGSNPVIEGDLLLVMVGGSPRDAAGAQPRPLDRVEGDGSGIVAFDKFTGQVKYKITDELASYAPLKLATIGGRRWCFAFCRGGLVGFEPATGKVDFQYPWRAAILESVNASGPVVVANRVLISETYGPGSSLLEVSPGSHKVIWKDTERTRAKALQTHWNTPIYHDGFVFGCSGRHTENADLRCLDWKTGKVLWKEPGTTRVQLTYVDGHFLSLGEYGELKLIRARGDKFDLVAEAVIKEAVPAPVVSNEAERPLLKYPCWAAPVISHGLLYARGADRLVCLELIPDKN